MHNEIARKAVEELAFLGHMFILSMLIAACLLMVDALWAAYRYAEDLDKTAKANFRDGFGIATAVIFVGFLILSQLI